MSSMMQQENPTISLIFVNYKSERYLEGALRGLFSSEEMGGVEIIIVNNDSSESQKLNLLQKEFPVKIVENTRNKGFSAAVNQGVYASNGSILGLLNPDIVWPKKQLQLIVRKVLENKGIVGIALLDERGRIERFSFGKTVTLWRLFQNRFQRSKRVIFRQDQVVDWVSGGALFFERKTFDHLEGFDEGYFLYYEDVDFCERARQRGVPIIWTPEGEVKHFRGASSQDLKTQKNHYQNSQKYYFQKFRPRCEQKGLACIRMLES